MLQIAGSDTKSDTFEVLHTCTHFILLPFENLKCYNFIYSVHKINFLSLSTHFIFVSISYLCQDLSSTFLKNLRVCFCASSFFHENVIILIMHNKSFLLVLLSCTFLLVFNIPEVNETNSVLTVTISPERQVHIDGIGDAMVTCSVNGSANGTIKWSFNGGSLPRQAVVTNDNSSLMSTLYISPVLKSHKGSYSCVVIDGVKNGAANSVIEVMSKKYYAHNTFHSIL